MLLCNMAELYYERNKDKFHFNYEIIDWDGNTSHFPIIDMKKVFVELVKPNDEIYSGRQVDKNE